MNGWIKIYRQLLDWEWYHDTNVVRIFLHLLLKANHKNSSFEGKTIKRGQHVTSLSSLSRETGLTIQQTRTALNKLQMTGEVTSKTTNRYTVLTINNFDKFQSNNDETTCKTTNEQQTNNTPDNNQITTPKEYKNIYTDAFQHLWEYYKSHAQPGCPIGEKKSAFKKFCSLVKEFSEDTIFEHVKNYLESCEQTRTKTKHLVTFLNQHDFDEPVEPIRRQKTQWEIEQEHMQREIDYFRAQQ